MNKLESVVDAIAKLNGVLDPASDAYRLRNPLLIVSYARFGKHATDDKGRRIFDSYQNGYKAACFDLQIKIMGKSRSKIKPESPFVDLLRCYSVISKLAVDNIVSFVRRANGDDAISANTPVKYFLDEPEVK